MSRGGEDEQKKCTRDDSEATDEVVCSKPEGSRAYKRNISTCQRHDLSLKYATIGFNIQTKIKHQMIPEFEKYGNWRRFLCWKFPCDLYGPGGFVYRSIYDAMRAEKMRFMVDQLEIHTFLEFIRKEHAKVHPRDVVTVSEENFLSQNNLTLNSSVWDIVRKKILYGYIRQRIRVDGVFRYILQVLDQRSIKPILFYPHSTQDTYYFGKLSRGDVDTTYQKTTLRKKAKIEVNAHTLRNEIVDQENQQPVIGKNVYGELLIQAIRDHNLHYNGQTLNLRASRKLQRDQVHVTIPMYNTVPHFPEQESIDDIIDDLLSDPGVKAKESECLSLPSLGMTPTLPGSSDHSNSHPSSPISNSSTITSSGSIIF